MVSPPASPHELAELLPLPALPAWKAYVGLPLLGERLPTGGSEELLLRQTDDYVLRLLLPVVDQALQEFPTVVTALSDRYPIKLWPGIGVAGFSAGALVAMLALLEAPIDVTTALLLGAPRNLASAVSAYEATLPKLLPRLQERYPWAQDVSTQYTMDACLAGGCPPTGPRRPSWRADAPVAPANYPHRPWREGRNRLGARGQGTLCHVT